MKAKSNNCKIVTIAQLFIFKWRIFICRGRRGYLNSLMRSFKQPRRRRQQERHKFAYLTMKNNSFARFARAFFIFLYFADVLVFSTMSNDLFAVVWTTWACDDRCSVLYSYLWRAGSNLIPGVVRTHFASIMTLNNWEMVAETLSRRRLCL